MANLFYRPHPDVLGDVNPFFADGVFRLFYLKPTGGWCQVSTRDFVHFDEHGPIGIEGGSGCVLEAGGGYHLFYTGYDRDADAGTYVSKVCHAVSTDLLHWDLRPEDIFYADTDIYDPVKWGDPFVFWNDEEQCYWMLVASRLKSGPSQRRGCTALCVSTDLIHWQAREPLWAPGLYYKHEVPDLFRLGDWWYMVFSTFTDRFLTQYRMSRSLDGPWMSPRNNTFDARALYAAKTCSDGQHRYVFGWLAGREGERDYANWSWGGNLVVHEVVQEPDGSLSVRIPESVDVAFTQDASTKVAPALGPWEVEADRLSVSVPDSFACAVAREMPTRCKLSARVTFDDHTRVCGLMIRVSEDLDEAYYLRLEPYRNRLVFQAGVMYTVDGWCEFPDMVELERPVELVPGRPYDLDVYVDDTVCVVYVQNKVAMSARIYDRREGIWGVFVSEGSAQFSRLGMRVTEGIP